jgi:hypothetical protein
MSEAADAPVTEAEIGGTMAGFGPGKVAGVVGAPGDIVALATGLYKAAFPDADQGRLDAFIQQVEEVSNKFGSGATLGFLDDMATKAGIPEDVKQGFMQGAEVGSFFGLGQGAAATGKGVAAAGRAVAEGAPARIAERGEGVTLGMGVDPMAPIDEAIVGAQKLVGAAPRAGRVASAADVFSEVADFPDLTKSEEMVVAASSAPPEQVAGLGRVVTEPIDPQNMAASKARFDQLREMTSGYEQERAKARIVRLDDGTDAIQYMEPPATIQSVPISQLKATQPGLLSGGDATLTEGPPLVVKKGGEFFVRDGHHRLARMIEAGADTADVRVVDLDAGGFVGAEANPNRISTRLPTAKGATEDPIAQPLQIGLDEVKADPVVFEHNVGIVKNYPNMTDAEAALPPEQASEAFIEHAKNNLLWVFDKVPEQTRERSKKWYDGARAITDNWSKKYNLPDSSIAGVLAALSPQKDWYMNVSLGERVLDIMTNQQDTMFTKEMLKTGLEKFNKPQDQAIIKAISNKKLSELELPAEKAIWLRLHDETYADRSHQIVSPEGDFIGTAMTAKGEPKGTGWGSIAEISKAVSAFESGGDKNILTPLMGTKHKVRSFYNNILDPNGPNGDVTIDTHAVAAALLRPLSGQATEVHHNFGSSPGKAKQGADWFGATKNSAKTGVQGNYGLYAEAYRRAAAERGVLPREMQSITWEAVRGLFTDKFKGQAQNVDDINQIWYKYRKGEVGLDEARNAVEQRAGGINPPTWQRSDGGLDDKIQDTAD